MSPHEEPVREFELPRELEEQQRSAVRLERITIAYMLTAVVLLFLTLGQSQATKAAWIEDLLSLLPPAAVLIASRLRKRNPSEKFPWGLHRAVLEWKVYDIVVVPVKKIDIPSPPVAEARGPRGDTAGGRHDSSLSGSQ